MVIHHPLIAQHLLIHRFLDTHEDTEDNEKEAALTPRQELKKSISHLIGVIALVAFFVLSFLTGAWYITWMVFPLFSCINGLIAACIDLKEAK